MLIKAVVVIVLAVVFVPVLRLVWTLGFHLHYHKHHPGKCWKIRKTGTGSEDFQILTSGLTFITSGLIFPTSPPGFKNFVKSKGKGSIQIFDMNAPTSEAKALTMKHGKDFNPDIFRPHGLSVLEDKVNGEHQLYVINHAEGEEDRVEKFRYSPKTKELHHVKSISSNSLLTTNDLVATDDDRFYVTNWLYFKNDLSLLEQIYQLPTGSVVFYNGTGFTPVIEGLHDPNGVLFSKDKRYLYVSLPNLQLVNVYKKESAYDFRLVQEIKVHTSVDNFHLSENGDSLFAGCHPIGYSAVAHFFNPTEKKAHSQVLQFPLKDGLVVEEEITQLFYDHGDLISASSIAGVYKDKLLIGSVMDTLAICERPKKE